MKKMYTRLLMVVALIITTMQTSTAGINNIKKEEGGFQAKAYIDAAGKSIGFGHFIQANESHLLTAVWNEKQATAQLMADLKPLDLQLSRDTRYGFNQNQHDAMAELGYNIGSGALAKILETWVTTKSTDKLFAHIRQYKYSTDPVSKKKVINNTLVARRERTIKNFQKPVNPIPKTAIIAGVAVSAVALLAFS